MSTTHNDMSAPDHHEPAAPIARRLKEMDIRAAKIDAARAAKEPAHTIANDPELAEMVARGTAMREKAAAFDRALGLGGESDADVANVAPETNTVTADDFYAYLPDHSYIFVPTRQPWPASSVDSVITLPEGKASRWLDQERPVHQMTWCPGMPMVINDRLVADGGWIERKGTNTFNLYRPPVELEGDPAQAGPWLAHAKQVYPNEWQHLVHWLAHRVQRPAEKLNHALVLGGDEGIGKDSLLEPVKYAVGPWNFAEVSPQQLLGRFNGFLKSVILRMSEARDLGDVDRYTLHEHLKPIIAAPPDVLRCDEKNLREHAVLNKLGLVITTNHEDGLYIPADSRRYFVAWSELTKETFDPEYWKELHAWYADGGVGHVGAYLRTLDLSDFDAKAPPPKTAAFLSMVAAGRAPEDGELADALDALGNPAAVAVSTLAIYASESLREWLQDRRNARQLPHRMKSAGYAAVRNEADQRDGQWKLDGKRQTVYCRRDLTERDRLAAASALVRKDRQ